MEEDLSSPLVLDGSIRSIKFGIATDEEIRTYSINECPISHPTQLTNPFLGLPLEAGKCESCGTAEHGKCEGHFGYIELPIPVYHPSHVSELRQILSLLCLNCLRMKKGKVGKESISTTRCFYCRAIPPISIKEVKTTDGALFLELRVSARNRLQDGFWNFLDRFGFHYGDSVCRPLLPLEALNILKAVPEETRRKLAAKGCSLQTGYIMQHLPVPPNCLSVPEISDGKSVMSYDISLALLKRVLHKIELIKRSRSGSPNFESHEVESNDLQSSIAQYMHLRGTTKGPQDITKRFAVGTEASGASTKQWLEKMKTLFISKGSGFSSRSVITGDPYIGVNVIGLPSEIAQRITIEERVTKHNMSRLQEVVDNRLCITYKDGSTTYAIAVGSKGHTFLKVGQIVNRRIVDGDIVFVNRPPSTHKHSLQAFYVFVHDDHTVKINPLICSPLGADFDGDCVHLFYPQSLSAKAEALELFSVEKQLLCSHNGNVNLQLVHDSLLALKLLFAKTFLRRETAEQLAMFIPHVLSPPAILKACKAGPFWTINQILQSALPDSIDCFGEKQLVSQNAIINLDFDRESVQASFTEVISSIISMKGPKNALEFFDVVQPLLMEMLFLEGFSISLKDFDVPRAAVQEIKKCVQRDTYILDKSRSDQNQIGEMQVDNHLKRIKRPVVDFIQKISDLGLLIDPKSDSAIAKIVQQLGFLGLQLFQEGKLYSRRLVEDCFSSFVNKFSTGAKEHPSEAYGLVKSSFFHGLNPYEELVHAISCREVIVRSSRGLTEPGTLFKNLMAILRDVVICYDGSVRNICSNTIIQFEYGDDKKSDFLDVSPPGEPVGVLAATAISNPAYKAVLDSSQSNNTSWELMKEILLTRVNYKNSINDRRIVLFLNDCFCGKKFCKEREALAVQSFLKRIKLEDCATEFTIEYQKAISLNENSETTSGLVGHLHLDKMQLELSNISMEEILQKCQEVVQKYIKKKGLLSHHFKRITLAISECCSTQMRNDGELSHIPCLQISYSDGNASSSCESLERVVHVLGSTICPVLLDTIVKGDHRIHEAKIVWVGPDTTFWVRNFRDKLKGELAVEVVVDRDAAQKCGDAWRTLMDACLPLMNLIDTLRSCPYSVQQVREVLGISCCFEQAVERLAASIKTVAKGVLKEHLVLLANSMTCTGTLNGFNTSGYRALFRSLRVQVPFTEATLLTPMKCFERAAEKCHSDSLDSVVSACSWGKNVALGTGSVFQILWDQRQLANDNMGKGMYDFLSLVRTSQRKDNGMIFKDDYLEEENISEEWCLSPEPDGGFGKPSFDDDVDSEYNIQKSTVHESGEGNKSSWEKHSSPGRSDSWDGWANAKASEPTNLKLAAIETGTASSAGWEKNSNAPMDFDDRQGWSKEDTNGRANIILTESKDQQKVDSGNILSGSKSGVWSNWDASEALKHSIESKKPTEQVGQSSWNKLDLQKDRPLDHSGTWEELIPIPNKSSWESKGHASEKNESWTGKFTENQAGHDARLSRSGSGGTRSSNLTHNMQNIDYTQDSKVNEDWGQATSGQPEDANVETNWNQNVSTPSSAWDGQSSLNTNAGKSDQDGWGRATSGHPGDANVETKWNQNVSTPSSAWDGRSSLNANSGKTDHDGWGHATSGHPGDANVETNWNQNVSTPSSAWGGQSSLNANAGKSDQDGWNEVKVPDNDNQSWKSDGWGSSKSNWRSQKSSFGRPQRKMDGQKGFNPGSPFVPSRRRLDSLTTDEENILAEIEPVMQNIKRIVRESSDGDKLRPDDEKFIIEKVFEHHPDKQQKVAGEIDYVKVDKHQTFQSSRCFYVVSSDGSTCDFSYLKCMDNFVRKTYPDHGEGFSKKYFKRPQREPSSPSPSLNSEAKDSEAT